jgi:hypothetical protein
MKPRQFKKACSQSMPYLSAIGYDENNFYVVNDITPKGNNSQYLAWVHENNSIYPAFYLLVDYLNENVNESVSSLTVRHVFNLASRVIQGVPDHL